MSHSKVLRTFWSGHPLELGETAVKAKREHPFFQGCYLHNKTLNSTLKVGKLRCELISVKTFRKEGGAGWMEGGESAFSPSPSHPLQGHTRGPHTVKAEQQDRRGRASLVRAKTSCCRGQPESAPHGEFIQCCNLGRISDRMRLCGVTPEPWESSCNAQPST